jgi:hypothetical protein
VRETNAGELDETRRAVLLAEYAEVSDNFRLLTDIRFKLLAFMPLAIVVAVAGLQVVASSNAVGGEVSVRTVALFLFGLLVTVGLATYNARNDQLYLWCVTRGAEIERELGLYNGFFAFRPNAWWDFDLWRGRWVVGHSRSINAIYGGAAALWGTGLLAALAGLTVGDDDSGAGVYAVAAVLAAASTIAVSVALKEQKKRRTEKIIAAGEEAIKLAGAVRAVNVPEGCSKAAGYDQLVNACECLIGREHAPAERRGEVAKRIELLAAMSELERRRYGIEHGDPDEADRNYVAALVNLPPTLFLRGFKRR